MSLNVLIYIRMFFIKHKNVLFLFRKTKVFMKYYHLDQLSDVFQRMGVSAIKIQKGI